MNKKVVVVLTLWIALMLASFFLLFFMWKVIDLVQMRIQMENTMVEASANKNYQLIIEGDPAGYFASLEDAIAQGSAYGDAYILQLDINEKVWDNTFSFGVYYADDLFQGFSSILDAYTFAKENEPASIYYIEEPVQVWRTIGLQNQKMIGTVPILLQKPQLDRGCEVTALAMLLNANGITADKMTLAQEIAKDTTPKQIIQGEIHYGNPYYGFVGDMVTYQNDGFGVYHGPVYQLAEQYAGKRAVDITGAPFSMIMEYVQMERPVWVIHNTTYRPLATNTFETWQTPQGEIQITYREHALVIIGFDDTYIYFNDPLKPDICKEEKKLFEEAWVQMGRQAVVILAEDA